MRALRVPTLSDPHGLWCGYCLEYFSHGEPRIAMNPVVSAGVPRLATLACAPVHAPSSLKEEHHLLPKLWINRSTTPDGPLHPHWNRWTIPLHRHCHRIVQELSDGAAHRASSLGPNPFASLAALAWDMFSKGQLAWAMYIRTSLREHARREGFSPAEQLVHLKYELAAAAGLWFCPWPISREFRSYFHSITGASDLWSQAHYVDLLLFCINGYLATHSSETSSLLANAAGVLGGRRHKGVLHAKLLRLSANFSFDPKIAQLAADSARECGDDYTRATTVQGQAWAYIAQGQFSKAYGAIEGQVHLARASFWHVMQEDIARAYVKYLDRAKTEPSLILGHIIRAQYIQVWMGLRSWHLPSLQSPTSGDTTEIWPIDVLETFLQSQSTTIGREQLLQIRRTYLLGTVRDTILRDLLGVA